MEKIDQDEQYGKIHRVRSSSSKEIPICTAVKKSHKVKQKTASDKLATSNHRPIRINKESLIVSETVTRLEEPIPAS